MKKSVLIILLSAILLTSLNALGGKEPVPDPFLSQNEGSALNYNLDLANPQAGDAIILLNRFYIEKDLNHRLTKIYNNYEKKIHFEFHMGFSQKLSGDFGKETKNSDDARSYDLLPLIMLKLNVTNPKHFRPAKTLNEIRMVEEIMEYAQIRFTQKTLGDLAKIRSDLLEYQSNWLYRRISLGVALPFLFYNSGDYDHRFLLEDLNVFVGYDLADFATLSAGYNLTTGKDFYLTLSTDISTPVMELTDFALDFFK